MDNNQRNEFNKILMPVIRDVMPNILASQIAGVQPMTGPTGQIFGHSRSCMPERIRFTKDNYRHFLRLNDRKTSQTHSDIKQAGYRYQTRTLKYEEIGWVEETLGDRVITFYDTIYFAYETDLTLYLLRWS